MRMTTWHKEISNELESHNETWKDVLVSDCTLNHIKLHKEFDSSYGGVRGAPFTIWSKKRVYFPATHGGAEWCASVSRNPDGIPTNHIGW